MAMIWDAFLVSALSRELDSLLAGARLRGHLFRWNQRELVLFFRSGTLRWFLHPEKGWFSFDAPRDPPKDARPLAAEVRRVLAPPDERILEIRLRRPRGRVRHFRLVVELMTNQWNALLLEGPEGRIRHLLWTRHLEGRDLVVGREYRPPPPSRRRGTDGQLNLEAWREMLEGRGPQQARKTLLETVAFTSPTNVPFLLGSSGTGVADSHALARGWERWQQLARGETIQACLLETDRGDQPYPYVIEGYKYTEFSNIISAIQAASQGDEEKRGGAAQEDREALVRAVGRARGRVRGIQREMEEAEDPEEPRALANLLLARLAQVPRGADAVVLKGFQGEEVRISLDPALAPQENAEALYQEASRRERARERLPELLTEAEETLQRLAETLERLEAGSLSPEEVRDVLPAKDRRRKPGQKQEVRLPYHTFMSSGGLEIRVGRGSGDNDDLTFRHSSPNDIWLHARDSAGAHVILRWDRDENPPRRDLAEAAILAALNSGARNAGTVPVDWTRRKHVRKPRKAPPGSVIPREVQTLFVKPDPELPKRLRSWRPSPP